MAFLDPQLHTHTAAHDVLELQFNPSPPAAKSGAAAPSEGPKKPYTRYNVNSPEGHVMLAKYARAIEIMQELPDYDQRSWTWWWNTHWIKGFPAFLWDHSRKLKTERHRVTPAGVLEPMPRPCGTAARPTPTTPPTLSSINSGTSCPGID